MVAWWVNRNFTHQWSEYLYQYHIGASIDHGVMTVVLTPTCEDLNHSASAQTHTTSLSKSRKAPEVYRDSPWASDHTSPPPARDDKKISTKKLHTKIRKQFEQPIWSICSYKRLQFFEILLIETFCTSNHRSASVPWPSSHAAWTKATKAMAWQQVKVLQLESPSNWSLWLVFFRFYESSRSVDLSKYYVREDTKEESCAKLWLAIVEACNRFCSSIGSRCARWYLCSAACLHRLFGTSGLLLCAPATWLPYLLAPTPTVYIKS